MAKPTTNGLSYVAPWLPYLVFVCTILSRVDTHGSVRVGSVAGSRQNFRCMSKRGSCAKKGLPMHVKPWIRWKQTRNIIWLISMLSNMTTKLEIVR